MVCTDRTENVCALASDIGIDKVVAEFAHRQTRHDHSPPKPLAPADYADSRHQLMDAAPQLLQLHPNAGKIFWLVEPLIAKRQDLVGADDQSLRVIRRNATCLCLRQRERTGAGGPTLTVRH